MKRKILLLLPLLFIACGAPPGDQQPVVAVPEARAETQNIRNTDAIGYGGSGIANKLDAALDANDRRKDELNARLNAMK
jgi:hypothetical protein